MSNEYCILARRSRQAVIVAYFGLLLVFSLSTLFLPTCGRSPNVTIWLIHMLPLVMFIAGMLKQNVRSHVWLAFISLGYFATSVTGVFGCQSLLNVLEVILVTILFIASLLYVRWRSRELRG